MSFKVVACLVIVLCAGKIGFGIAAGYSGRVRELNGFICGMGALRREISFCLTPMEQALKQAAAGLPEPVADVFCNAGKLLENDDSTANEAWCNAVCAAGECMHLTGTELETLESFGHLLGTGDLEAQTNNVDMMLDKLSALERQAAGDEQKYARSCRSLGILFGIFVALIFI